MDYQTAQIIHIIGLLLIIGGAFVGVKFKKSKIGWIIFLIGIVVTIVGSILAPDTDID